MGLIHFTSASLATRVAAALALLSAMMFLPAAPSAAENRIALVIGNSYY